MIQYGILGFIEMVHQAKHPSAYVIVFRANQTKHPLVYVIVFRANQ